MRKRTIMRTILTALLAAALAQGAQKTGQLEVDLQAAIQKETVQGDLKAAIAMYEKILARAGANRAVAAKALIRIGKCYDKMGDAEARKAYERVLRDYAGETEQVQDARAGLAALGRPAHPSAVTLRRVWAGTGSDATGTISPDGRYLSFTDWETGDLAVRDLATGQNHRLTRTGSWNDYSWDYADNSVVSRDGKRVAYGWHNKDSYYDLRVVGLDGSEPRVLVAEKEWTWLQPFDWSPDGQEILAILSRKNDFRIVLVSTAQGSVRVLKEWPDSRWPNTMSLSPDGRYIVCDPSGGVNSSHDILLLSSAGGEETPLIQHPAKDWNPVWAPDGKKVVFASDRTGGMDLWAIGVADGKPQGVPELVKPAIGRFTRLMGFTREGSLYYAIESGMQDVYVAELDPATGKVVAQAAPVANRFAGTNMGPSWSPDGQYLAYHSHRGPQGASELGALTIVIKSVKTGEERDLSVKLRQDGPVRWFPDGKSFLVGGTTEDQSGQLPGFYRINAESGEVSLIKRVTGAARPLGVNLSPDGKAIFYVHRETGKGERIMVYQMETGEEKELFRTVSPQSFGSSGRLDPSPDGRQLAFVLRDPATSSTVVKIMPVSGGELRELVGGPRYRDVELGGWSPDGRYLFIVTGGQGVQPSQLWRVPAEGGEPQKLDVNMQRQWYNRTEGGHSPHFPAVHPDGRRIVFETGRGRDIEPEIWVMENLLPELKAPARE
jgi:Tol biopolymer transport system component